MSRRTLLIILGTFVLLLGLTPFVPRGGDEHAGLRPSGEQDSEGLRSARTAGLSKVTDDARAEIDRVVAASRAVGRVSARQSPEQLASSLVQCADFEGQRYCLGTGWTEDTRAEVADQVASSIRTETARRTAGTGDTGDLDPETALLRRARMSPTARAAADRAELTRAARSIAKVWLLRHEIEGVPLPDGFLAAHPEARAQSRSARLSTPNTATASPSQPTKTSGTVKGAAAYPRRATVLNPKNVAAQTQTYWCGPTTMQMIVWGWTHHRRTQRHWAERLHTTTSGTSITDMVRVVNRATGWDNRWHAGPYIVLDIGDYSYRQWMLLMMRHIHDYQAPVVLHPILLKRYYPYLDDDASGHFQVGRGYAKRGDKPNQISYFEPWNQQRFDPSEPYIARVQWRDAYRSYRANEAHYAHNVGV